jgi:arginine decarboxylase
MNYTLAEYASDVVYRSGSLCNARGIEHPVIVSESGRAIAAHHSLLVFDVLGSSQLDRFKVGDQVEQEVRDGTREVPQPVKDLLDAYRSISDRRLVECYHDALQAREQALQMFSFGYLGLEARGLVERLYWATCLKIRDMCRRLPAVPEELEGLETMLSDIYFCNVSIFQSLPDSWAIDQVFPIMPVHRLEERPSRSAVLADITCDSDGKIDHFVSLRESKRALELHDLEEGDPNYIAVFLVGACQETLGDLHNLFGDTHVVHIKLHDEGGWWIEETVKGDSATEVLRYMQYDVERLVPQFARDCERAVREGRISLPESQAMRRFYEAELAGYTYLEPA